MPTNGLSIPSFKLTTSSRNEIRPTTAGLSPQAKLTSESRESRPSSSQSSDQRVVFCYPSDLKNELQARQSSLLSLNSTSPSSLSIDERIKLNKELHRDSSSSLSDRHNYNSSISPEVPERLLSGMQRDKQPFAYTANINDPNNRGKLDLSQIKSATMRRRLLANMASKSNDSDEDATSVCAPDYNVSPDPRQELPVHGQDTETVHHRYYSHPPVRSYINNDVQTHSSANSYDYPKNDCHVSNTCERTSVRERPILIHHKEPPQFYHIGQDQSFSERNQVGSTRKQSNEADIDRLSAELFESLDGLSSFISQMGRGNPQTQQQTRPVEPTLNYKQQVHEDTKWRTGISTFKPNQSHARIRATNNQSDYEQSTPKRSFMSVLPSGRTPGDYLLSGDLNYFTPLSSNKEPYSMSTYYSEPLDVDLCYNQEHGSLNNRATGFARQQPSTFSSRYHSNGSYGLPTSQHQRDRI